MLLNSGHLVFPAGVRCWHQPASTVVTVRMQRWRQWWQSSTAVLVICGGLWSLTGPAAAVSGIACFQSIGSNQHIIGIVQFLAFSCILLFRLQCSEACKRYGVNSAAAAAAVQQSKAKSLGLNRPMHAILCMHAVRGARSTCCVQQRPSQWHCSAQLAVLLDIGNHLSNQ
jgi:hypothetical protein